MADYTREQLIRALRNADAAGDTEAARVIARRIRSMDQPQSRFSASASGTAQAHYESVPSYLWRATKNTLGAAPAVVANTADLIINTSPQNMGFRLAGAAGNALAGRPPNLYDKLLGKNATSQAGPAINALIPPEQDMQPARTASEFAFGMLIPGPKFARPLKIPSSGGAGPATSKAIEGASEVIEQGVKRGVPVFTSNVKPPRTIVGKNLQKVGEVVPFGMAGKLAGQQQARVDAVVDFAEEYGVNTAGGMFDDAGRAADAVAKDFLKTRAGRLSSLVAAKGSVITRLSGSPVKTPQAIAAIDKEIIRLQRIGDDSLAPFISRLEGWKANLGSGKSLDDIEGIRKIMGKTFDDPSLATIREIGKDSLQRIYGPLRADMGNFINAKGGKDMFAKWKGANDQLAAMAGELRVGRLKSVLRNADATPEEVGKLLFSTNRSDVARLYNGLSPAGKAKARSAIVEKAFQRATSAREGVSPDTFATQFQKLAKERGILFSGAERAEAEGLIKLLNATRHAAEASLHPPTGAQNFSQITALTLGSALGMVKGLLTAGGAGLAARVYESAPVRNALVGYGKSAPRSIAERVAIQKILIALAATNDNMAATVARSPAARVNAEEQDDDVGREPIGGREP